MEIEDSVVIDASPETIFPLAAEVERWPEILPHYRWVHVLEQRERQRVVKMGAQRDGYPCSWTAIQEPRPEERRILFWHVGGATRGMEVEWRLQPLQDGQTRTSIWHKWSGGGPPIGGTIARRLILKYFVHNIAGKTLRRIKALAEAEQAATNQPQAQRS